MIQFNVKFLNCIVVELMSKPLIVFSCYFPYGRGVELIKGKTTGSGSLSLLVVMFMLSAVAKKQCSYNKLFLFQVYKENELFYYIDGFDVAKSNWMRYVNPAYSSESQNLIACQYKMSIYFYTIKPILPNQELLVWYCKEFAERLNYPLTGELMLLRISKYANL